MLVGLVTIETGGGHSKNAPFCVTFTGVVTIGWALDGVVSVGALSLDVAKITKDSGALAIALGTVSVDVTGLVDEVNTTSDSPDSTLTIAGVVVGFDWDITTTSLSLTVELE